MGFVLDSIIKLIVLDGPQSINSTFTSDVVDLDNREGEFSVTVSYDGGISLNMTTSIELSNTPENSGSWVQLEDSDLIQTDASGTIVYDIQGTGLSYMRIKIVVASGSCNLQSILYVAKRRH